MSPGLILAFALCVQGLPEEAPGKDLPVAPPSFSGPERCAPCHPQHYQEWRGSSHAFAAVNPIVQACHRQGLLETKGAIGDLCIKCHAPGAARTGELAPAFDMKLLSPVARHGVSCEICHRMEPPPAAAPIANASFQLAGGNVVYGRLKNPTATPAHESMTSEFVGTSAFCGSCHDVLHNGGLIERAYDQWRTSVHAQREEQCQNCHMVRYAGQAAVGGPFRETLHRHNFPAATVPLVPFPNRGQQEEEVLEVLRSSARMSVMLPAEVEAGKELAFQVRVKNSGAGHNFPTGISNERQLWLEVTVTDASGRTLLSSGGLDEDQDLMNDKSRRRPGEDTFLTLFSDRFLDAQGKEVPFIWFASSVDSRSLRPLEERPATYRVPVDPGLVGSTLTVKVRLLFRSFAPYALRYLGLDHLVKELAVWELDSRVGAPIRVVQRLAPRKVLLVPEDEPSIEVALDRARDGDEILVAPGSHEVVRPIDFRGKSLTLRGRAGPGRTTLMLKTGSPREDEGSVVQFLSDESRSAVLEGFTISGGRGNLVDGKRSGGGVIVRGASPTLRRLRIEGTSAEGGQGGGLAILSGEPRIEDVVLVACTAREGAGIYAASRAGPLAWTGGGIEGCVAERGAAIFLDSGASLALERVEIAGNTAARDGAVASLASGAELQLAFATVVFNRSGGAGPWEGPGTALMSASHSIIHGNIPPVAPGIRWERCLVDFEPTHPELQRGFPLFMDPTGTWDERTGRWIRGDYHLLWGSPAIDAGSEEAPADEDDTRADLGAFAFQQLLRPFVRGDVSGDGALDMGDLDLLARALGEGAALPCRDAADLDDNGRVDAADLLQLSAYLLATWPPPTSPWPSCGLDPTPGEGLSCDHKALPCKDP